VAQVLGENDGRWESASPRDLVRVEALARSIANRILHEPTIRLRSLSEDRSHASLQLVRELFALQEDGEKEASGEDTSARADGRGTELAEVHDLQRRRRKGT
jgi:glutamyl-tRNA reductase